MYSKDYKKWLNLQPWFFWGFLWQPQLLKSHSKLQQRVQILYFMQNQPQFIHVDINVVESMGFRLDHTWVWVLASTNVS